MTIQWTYDDYVTKGPLVENVLSWSLREVVTNRGTYNNDWPINPMAFSEAAGRAYAKMVTDAVSFSTTVGADAWRQTMEMSTPAMPDDATFLTGTTGAKWRVPDNIMKTPPKTRTETVRVLTFYNSLTQNDATTIAQVFFNNIVDWYVVP